MNYRWAVLVGNKPPMYPSDDMEGIRKTVRAGHQWQVLIDTDDLFIFTYMLGHLVIYYKEPLP